MNFDRLFNIAEAIDIDGAELRITRPIGPYRWRVALHGSKHTEPQFANRLWAALTEMERDLGERAGHVYKGHTDEAVKLAKALEPMAADMEEP